MLRHVEEEGWGGLGCLQGEIIYQLGLQEKEITFSWRVCSLLQSSNTEIGLTKRNLDKVVAKENLAFSRGQPD